MGKEYTCKRLKDSFACENPVFQELRAFSKAQLQRKCVLHLALLCDWLTGYRAEHRASQVSGEEGKQRFSKWDVLLRDR